MVEQTAESELEKIVASDLPKCVCLLDDLTTNLNTTRVGLEALMDKIKDGTLKTGKGLSLLELKNQTLLSYMMNLTYLTMRKLKGLKIENDPSIERLVEYRVVLERLRPLEDKLKYQIDKYVKVATEGVVSADDPSQLKGNLDNIGSSSDEEDSGTEDKPQKTRKADEEDKQVYKIPKISQTPYDHEESLKEAKEKARKRALNSSMLRDALYEHTDDPEVVYNIDILKQKSVRKRKELETYEEDHMLRKTVSRRERASMREMTTLGTMGSEMLSFNSLDPLRDDYDPTAGPAAKKRKMAGKSSKGKKGKSKGKKGIKKKRKH